jgi:hypothetical protein
MSIRWEGLTDYKVDLTSWPPAAAAAAGKAIERHANQAFQTIYSNYPVITGRLRAGLQKANKSTDPMHPVWQLRNDVVYARAWETGGMSIVGPLKAGKLFIPTMQRERRWLQEDLIAILETGAARVTVAA